MVAGWAWAEEVSPVHRYLFSLSRRGLSRLYGARHLEVVFGEKGNISTQIILSFDCDLEEDVRVYPILVGKMREVGIQGCFACIGTYVRMFPDEHRLLVEHGHEIMNHTMTHPHHRVLNPHRRFNQLADDELRREIEEAHEVIESVLGVQCKGFRSPHFGGLHTRRVYPILRQLGYEYSSSTIATRTPTLGRPFKEAGVWEIPLTPSLKDAFTCPETWAIRRATRRRYKDAREFVDEIKKILEIGMGRVSVLNFYFDPCDMANIDRLADRLLEVFSEYRQCITKYEDYVISLEKYERT